MAAVVPAQGITIAPAEGAGYLPVIGEQICYRIHRPKQTPTGAVLMLGPWGSERAYAYSTWTRWGRTLASRGFLAMQFDYRGLGESTGDSRLISFSDHLDDARSCLELLRDRAAGLPILLHGLRFGALVARGLIEEQLGHALLEWDPPETAADGIRDVLRYRLAEDAVRETGAERRVANVDELIERLDAGEDVMAEGHWISASLWEELKRLQIQPEVKHRHTIRLTTRRTPGQTGAETVVIPSPPFWRPGRRLVPDLDELFQKSQDWIETAVGELRP